MTYLTDKQTQINDLLNKMRELIGEDPRSVTETPKEVFLPEGVLKNVLAFCGDTIEDKQKKHMKQLCNDFKTVREFRARWNKDYGEDLSVDWDAVEKLFLQFEEGCVYHDRGEWGGEGIDEDIGNEQFIAKWVYGYGYCFQYTNMCFGTAEFRNMLVAEGYDWFPVVGDTHTDDELREFNGL